MLRLDPAQQQVVGHRRGALLVLAGPGTGKTTTIVESAVARMSDPDDPLAPESVLILTFGRKAAAELRDRVVARIGGGAVPAVLTFHSFCHALLRQWSGDGEALRLLTGPEQELRLREILAGTDQRWPDGLRSAATTRGMAPEVRAVLSRARSLGLDPDDVVRIGRSDGVPEWAAVGEFAEEYLDVLDAEGVTDYAELVHRASLLARRDDVRRHLHSTYRAILVDEYQDTDPAQVRLLRAITGPAASLVAVGDPDQAIYAFRGADVGGLLRFREQFGSEIVVLDRTRRFGPDLRRAATAVLGSRAFSGIPIEEVRRHRSPACEGQTVVEVLTYDDDGARAAHIADRVRRARLESLDDANPLRWSDIALLVRSGVRQIPALRRALSALGVPVEVAGDELPLHHEPAVAPLLLAMRVVAEPSALTADAASALLLSPLGGLDPHDLRLISRRLRGRDPQRSSASLLRDAVRDPVSAEWKRGSDADAAWDRLVGLSALLARGREIVEGGAPPEDLLWWLWAGPRDSHLAGDGWGARLERAAFAGGQAGVRADRDLDAICALFDVVQHAADRRRGYLGLRNILDEIEGQVIPAGTMAEKGVRGDAVRILTAHRAKGLEWRMVVVVGADEGLWPDLRIRGSLLMPDRLTASGLSRPPTSADLLAEERRLFYVAMTRAREHLVIAAVGSPSDDGDQPSRFVDDLVDAGFPSLHVAGLPRRPLSLPGLVAALRRAAVDPASSAALRRAATDRLAVIAEHRVDGYPITGAADPSAWWGVVDPTPGPVLVDVLDDGTSPAAGRDTTLRVSASDVEGIATCPLRWFLSSRAGGRGVSGPSAATGSAVHALAECIGAGSVDRGDAGALLDDVWPSLGFEARWQSAAERADADDALARFVAYHEESERELVATELPLSVPVEIEGVPVELHGRIDRVEKDADGRLIPVDLKTSRTLPRPAEVAGHLQLGTYQIALSADGDEVGGAELVQLRHGDVLPQRQVQAPLDDEAAVWPALANAVRIVGGASYPPRVGTACRTCSFTRVCPSKRSGGEVVP